MDEKEKAKAVVDHIAAPYALKQMYAQHAIESVLQAIFPGPAEAAAALIGIVVAKSELGEACQETLRAYYEDPKVSCTYKAAFEEMKARSS